MPASPYTSPIFQARVKPGGIYDELSDLFSSMGPSAIANAEFGVDFFRQNFGDDFTSHFSYVDKESEEFNANVFGEILSATHGTVIDIKEIVKGTQSDGDFNAITLVGGVLYKMPESDNSHRNRSTEPRGVEGPIKKCSIDVMNAEGNALEKLAHVKSTLQIPNVGALYDPKLMLDYGGEVFSLDKAKLVQPNWCKMDDTLIVPWKNYLHLRQGTLIVANISIRMHVLQPKNRKKPKRKAYISFVYQAIINFLKVVAESDIPVAYPPQPAVSWVHNALKIASGKSSAASVL
ncbi:hypothetical protein EV368DRAFT_83353 [Lentinula lateritia]|nr:hypothetical protein EV368DRAFT_83353 [Lentinula lateritia]